MRYRSFGNEAVRNPAPPPPPPTEEQAFSVLGDALSGAEDLRPDLVMGSPAPAPTEAPMLPARNPHPTYSAGPSGASPQPVAPDPHAVLEMAPPPLPPHEPPALPQPVPTRPAASSAPAAVPAPAVQPPQALRPVAVVPEPPGSSLLQVLLGGPVQPQPAPFPPSPPPPVAPVITLQPAPAAMAPAPAAPVPAPPAPPRAEPPARPVAPLPMPMLAGLSAAPWPSGVPVGGTGSSLLDTLMGVGAGASAGGIHYPLLDALGDAMRGTAAEPSPRHWPAARVDVALPELLRRIAAGVRFARSAA